MPLIIGVTAYVFAGFIINTAEGRHEKLDKHPKICKN